MNNPLKIAFMTTVGRNVGDEFIREGIRSLFDDVMGHYEPYYVDKHDLSTLTRRVYDEGESLGDKFCDADIIVQSGAPVYWCNGNGRFTSYSESWAQALWFERIFKLGHSKLIFNLGAGAGQKDETDLESLTGDPKLVDFARAAGDACAYTSVRDELASRFLTHCQVRHELLPCPAFFAARRAPSPSSSSQTNGLLAINVMAKAGHYRLKSETSETGWQAVIDEMLPRLRHDHRLLFVAHDAREAEFQSALCRNDESVFLASDWRDYMSLYSRVDAIVANRVHGGVCVAGFGRPAVIIGNDARIGIARPMGIPALDSSLVDADWIIQSLHAQFENPEQRYETRIAFRDSMAGKYSASIRAALSNGERGRALLAA